MEWLAVDMRRLLRKALPQIGFGEGSASVVCGRYELHGIGVTKRLELIGARLHAASSTHESPESVREAIARHQSDVVRQWGAYCVAADKTLSLEDRLTASRRFAGDRNMSVRECAWMAFRPYLAADLSRGLRLLRSWVDDSNANIRRFAIEVTRPRSVWGAHIRELKANPSRGLPLLERVKADPSHYVRTAVANWLNDASKSSPEWVREVCDRWSSGAGATTRWIIRRSLRTIGPA